MYWFKPATLTGFTQASGQTVIPLGYLADFYHITVIPSEGATGSITFEARTRDAKFTPLMKGDNPIVVNVGGTSLDFIVDGYRLAEIRVTPSALTGTHTIKIEQASQ